MSAVEDAERALGDAAAAYQRLDVDGVVAHLAAATRLFSEAGEPRRAALACARLGDVYGTGMGNLTAARAWFTRASRFVADEPPCIEQGWVAVAAMGCDVDDPGVLLDAAELALDRARRFGDVNLETKALADGGLAHVRLGRIDQGMALLDEAMALACGPADDAEVAAKSVCSFFTACVHAGCVDRAVGWTDLLRRHGLMGSDPGPPVFLSSHCESLRASVLIDLGRWGEAEETLVGARLAFEETMAAPSWHPRLGLAELRTRQGRLAEAESLLVGLDRTVDGLLPAARLHLARGDLALARQAVDRGLRSVGGDRVRGVELLALLAEVERRSGDVDAARRTCDQIGERLGDLDLPALHARAAVVQARVLAADGCRAEAADVLDAALAGLSGRSLPWWEVLVLVESARVHSEAGGHGLAGAAARAARDLLARLDVVITAGDAELLDRLARHDDGVGAPRPAALTRAGKGWAATSDGTTARLPASKGVAHLAILLASPGVERHALDLVDRTEGTGSDVDRRRLGDAGELLDADARRAYRSRIEQLRAAIEDALDRGALEEAERMQAEIEVVAGQLAAAFGLGGRPRRAGSAAERARLNVTRSLRTAIARISEVLPEAGAVLDRRVRTGLYCAYDPAPDDPIRWIVDPPGSFTPN